jgi:hypothetical protein
VLLVCTHRPEFVSSWARKSYHSGITLARLSPLRVVRCSPSCWAGGGASPHSSWEKPKGSHSFEELVQSCKKQAPLSGTGRWRLKPRQRRCRSQTRSKKCSWPVLTGCRTGQKCAPSWYGHWP